LENAAVPGSSGAATSRDFATISQRKGMNDSPIHILHLEDNEIDADYMATLLREEGLHFEIHRAVDRLGYRSRLEERRFDLIVSDYSMPSFNGGEALRLARQLSPETPFMFVSGTIGEELAVNTSGSLAFPTIQRKKISPG
jgi:CheY-like chemotaxis protein